MKKDGGTCPIIVGNVLRWLASKAANHYASHKVSNLLRPVQLGVSVKHACKAAVYSARIITKSLNYILAKLDIKNTFNSIRQNVLLSKCITNCPDIFRLSSLAHGSPTLLMVNGHIIWSNSGVPQGDIIGPLLFSLAIHVNASTIKSNFSVWYLDDATFAGDPRSVCDDIKWCSSIPTDISLFLNPSKCELVNLGLDEMVFLRKTLCINSILENVSFVEKENVILLGSPLTSTAIRSQFQHKLSIFKVMTEKLSLLDLHPAYFLLKDCFAMPKLMYLLRNSPTFQHPDLLADFDDCLKSCATDICNASVDDIVWIQATLPIRLGGIGLPCASDIALPAYLASISAIRSLISEIALSDSIPNALDSCFDVWSSTGPITTWKPKSPTSVWRHQIIFSLCYFWDSCLTSTDWHVSSATQPKSGVWMNCFPSTAIGTLLDNESIAISQRLCLPVCAQHKCCCGATVDKYGLHPLSCRLSAGHLPRHSALNDIIKRALSTAVLETVVLDRGDGKHPDGMTVFPFSMGKYLIWILPVSTLFPPQHWLWLQLGLDQHLAQLKYVRALSIKGYVIDTLFKQSLLNLLVCLDEIHMPSFLGWVTWPHQSVLNVA